MATEAEARVHFLCLWPLKEAYLKSRGIGLTIPLTSLSFDLTKNNPLLISHEAGDSSNNGWQFRELSPTLDHKLTLAYLGPLNTEIELHTHGLVLTIAFLMKCYR